MHLAEVIRYLATAWISSVTLSTVQKYRYGVSLYDSSAPMTSLLGLVLPTIPAPPPPIPTFEELWTSMVEDKIFLPPPNHNLSSGPSEPIQTPETPESAPFFLTLALKLSVMFREIAVFLAAYAIQGTVTGTGLVFIVTAHLWRETQDGIHLLHRRIHYFQNESEIALSAREDALEDNLLLQQYIDEADSALIPAFSAMSDLENRLTRVSDYHETSQKALANANAECKTLRAMAASSDENARSANETAEKLRVWVQDKEKENATLRKSNEWMHAELEKTFRARHSAAGNAPMPVGNIVPKAGNFTFTPLPQPGTGAPPKFPGLVGPDQEPVSFNPGPSGGVSGDSETDGRLRNVKIGMGDGKYRFVGE